MLMEFDLADWLLDDKDSGRDRERFLSNKRGFDRPIWV